MPFGFSFLFLLKIHYYIIPQLEKIIKCVKQLQLSQQNKITIMNIPRKKILYISLITVLIFSTLFAGILLTVHAKTRDLIYNYDELELISKTKVAIVFGASVNPTKDLPSAILADRIKTAVDLYKEGKVDKILMSGDNRVTHYNEPIIMQKYAEWFNVPSDDIVLDYAGRRTYDTCYRAKEIFQLDEAILVTQRYHLYRALYTCNSLGLDSIGVSSGKRPYKGQFSYNLREIPATLLAVWQVKITRPKPILGEKENAFD